MAAVKGDLQLRVRLFARRLFTPLAQAKFAAHFLRLARFSRKCWKLMINFLTQGRSAENMHESGILHTYFISI